MVTIRSKDEPLERTYWKDGIEHHEIRQCVLLHESPAETLVGADLHGLVLTCADLADTDLRDADLSKATLTSATFRRCRQGVSFDGCFGHYCCDRDEAARSGEAFGGSYFA